MANQVLSFEVDAKTLAVIDALKKQMNARDAGDVIKLSLALAQMAAANTDAQNVITLTDGADKKTTVKLER